ncbi:unnamed protein product [Spirodela intermedia]|uniref:Uncharacterized protein n=1 Tax=Spirodela intermedia TaxID=51605 RepID=A0A7I8KN49_SPIIN|nr:unnamed protein product [Spirodela intermedia]
MATLAVRSPREFPQARTVRPRTDGFIPRIRPKETRSATSSPAASAARNGGDRAAEATAKGFDHLSSETTGMVSLLGRWSGAARRLRHQPRRRGDLATPTDPRGGISCNEVEGEEEDGPPQVDPSDGEDGGEGAEGGGEEAEVTQEAEPVNGHGHGAAADGDTYDADDDGGDEEGAAEDATQADLVGGAATGGEGDDAGEEVGGAVAEREQGGAGDGGGQP